MGPSLTRYKGYTILTRQESDSFFTARVLIHFVLEYIQVVGCGYGNDIFLRVPGCVQDLLVEVQTINTNLVLLPLAP